MNLKSTPTQPPLGIALATRQPHQLPIPLHFHYTSTPLHCHFTSTSTSTSTPLLLDFYSTSTSTSTPLPLHFHSTSTPLALRTPLPFALHLGKVRLGLMFTNVIKIVVTIFYTLVFTIRRF